MYVGNNDVQLHHSILFSSKNCIFEANIPFLTKHMPFNAVWQCAC